MFFTFTLNFEAEAKVYLIVKIEVGTYFKILGNFKLYEKSKKGYERVRVGYEKMVHYNVCT